jgi:hypothetical protein
MNIFIFPSVTGNNCHLTEIIVLDTMVISTANESLAKLLPPGEIWILGAGKFGLLAQERLNWRYPKAKIWLIDKNPPSLHHLSLQSQTQLVKRDALQFIQDNPPSADTWIIPAIPVHVAFRWLIQKFVLENRNVSPISVPRSIDYQVPNPYRSDGDTLYASYATFICPDNCSEPDGICVYTRKARLGDLFEKISEVAEPDFQVMVIRSFQLAPGVGGYPGEHLQMVYQTISDNPGNYLVSTSCRCHGVINALRIDSARI